MSLVSVDDCGEEHCSSGFGCLWCSGQLAAGFFRPSDFGLWPGRKTENPGVFFGRERNLSPLCAQDSLSSDEIYHTYSLMVWQSICAIFHSGMLEFGDREMLFFLLLSSIW